MSKRDNEQEDIDDGNGAGGADKLKSPQVDKDDTTLVDSGVILTGSRTGRGHLTASFNSNENEIKNSSDDLIDSPLPPSPVITKNSAPDIRKSDKKIYSNVSMSSTVSPKTTNQIEIQMEDSPIHKSSYDRQKHYDYRNSHRDNPEDPPPLSIDPESDINKTYDQIKYEDDLKKTTAQIMTRIGFTAKGPAGAFEELQEMFSGGLIFLLIIGLWCYGCWGIFYVVFDIDRLGSKGAGAKLKRFGRIFSSGFYFVLGVDAAQVMAHFKKGKEGTEQILTMLYKHIVGRIIVILLGVTFFIVSIVYLMYFIRPAKFKRELATERMTKGTYYAALGFARIGAIGRSMFFAAFGAVLIEAVVNIQRGKEGDPTLLGFQGVFRAIAKFNYTLLFIIASLIIVYALWCAWLVPFRRLPAHADADVAQDLLGTKLDPNLKFNGMIFSIPRNGVTAPDTSLE
eukprot:gene5687-6571_t